MPESIDHDFDADQGILFVLDFHQLRHEFHDSLSVLLERLGMGQALEKRHKGMSGALQRDLVSAGTLRYQRVS